MDQKTKVFIAKFWGKDQQKKKIFISQNVRISTNSKVKTEKKVFISKNARIFTNSGVKLQKIRSLLQNLQKRHFLLTNSGVITSILGVSGLKLHFNGNELVTFFGAQSSLWGGTSLVWGSTSSDLGGTATKCPRGAGPVLFHYSSYPRKQN